MRFNCVANLHFGCAPVSEPPFTRSASKKSRHFASYELGLLFQRLIPTHERSGIADAHRDDGKRFVVHAEEKLTAFLELETAIPRFRGVKQQQGIGDPIAAYQARLYMKIK